MTQGQEIGPDLGLDRRIESHERDPGVRKGAIRAIERQADETVIGVGGVPKARLVPHARLKPPPEVLARACGDHDAHGAREKGRRPIRVGHTRVVCRDPARRHELDPASAERLPDDGRRISLCHDTLQNSETTPDDLRRGFRRVEDRPVRSPPLVLAGALVLVSCGKDVVPPHANIRSEDPGALPAHAADVADYTLSATLDPIGHTVHGEGVIGWRNTSRVAVRELWLHLYLNAFKNDRSAYLRERIGGRGSTLPEDWGFIDLRRLSLRDSDGKEADLLPALEASRAGDDDETDARVPLPHEIKPGERVVLDVAFDDKLPAVVERTGYHGTFHMVGQWFPKVARLEPDGTWAHFPFHHLAEFYADFGTYDVTIDVPAAYVIGATGPVVEARVQGGRRVERHVESDIHDFAWTAWDRFQTLHAKIADVDVTVLFPPGFAQIAERDLAAVDFALPYESALYGRYPYPVLTVVHPEDGAAEAGGMEYPTLITSMGGWSVPPGVLEPEIVTVHELGHQWFYGLVATDEASWPMLDEGINQFAEVDAMGQWRGEGSAGDVLGLRVSDAAIQAVSSNRAVHDEPVAQPASAFSSGASYGRLVYSRTAAVLDTLARVYGRDAVHRALGVYARRFRFEHPGPEALLAVFRETMGERPSATLRAALFDKGWVDYVVDHVTSERTTGPSGVFDTAGKRTTLLARDEDDWQGSVLVSRRGTLSFPVEIELFFADGSTHREPWDGLGESKHISWNGPVALRAAVVDPEDRVTIDMNRANNHAVASWSRSASAGRSLDRALYWAELMFQAVAP